ncbi:MAG: hypothetical protein GF355_11190 [Candidatus Eisenbacteria bacterium]|nr:hypothetical protein [Candidatus Eisenbacteria bacterium]
MENLSNIRRVGPPEALDRVEGLRERRHDRDKRGGYDGPRPGEDKQEPEEEVATDGPQPGRPEEEGEDECLDGRPVKGRKIDIKA